MMDVIEEIIKFRKDLDDAKKEIKGISGKNKKSAPAKKTKPAKVAPTSKSASKKKPQVVKKSKPAPKKKPSQVKKTKICHCTCEKNKTSQSRTYFKICIKKEATGSKKIKACSKEKTITSEKNKTNF